MRYEFSALPWEMLGPRVVLMTLRTLRIGGRGRRMLGR